MLGVMRLALLLGAALMTHGYPAEVNRDVTSSYGNYPRRTYQGRPFKAIIVTSKPLGYGNTNDQENVIKSRPATPTAVTTESPSAYKVAQPTIPFFSISCAVGSSCSQIISARKVPTPKPTFKPYTKEDKEKLKLAYSQVFGPTALLTASLTPNKLAPTTTTTTTTPRPTTPSIWRVRTTAATTLKPAITASVSSPPSTTTKSRPTLSSAIKEFAINSALESVSKWKWPSETINRNTMVVQSNPMKLAVPISTSKPVKNGAAFSPAAAAAAAADNSNNKNGASMSKWLSSLIVASLNNAIAQKINAPHVDQQKHHYNKPHVQNNEVKLVNNYNKPVEHVDTSSEPVQQFIGKEVINTKGHKTTIITGSSVRQQIKNNQQLNNNQNVKLPPEFTVSSHGIRLQVAPKSRGSRYIQNYQGVDIETDGADVNLSDLIMKHYPVLPKQY